MGDVLYVEMSVRVYASTKADENQLERARLELVQCITSAAVELGLEASVDL